MGSDLFDAYPNLLVDRSDDVLGWSLRDVCLNGPEEALTRTEHAQPALFALSYALWLAFASHLDEQPSGAAGHSLGEYTALTAAGVFEYDEALKVVAARGRAMATAADVEPSGMAALIGASEDDATGLAAKRVAMGGDLQVANLNAPGQIVVAGSKEDIGWLVENARTLGVRRAIPLKVAGAFHSSFMAPASEPLAEALADCSLGEPTFPVWANTTALPHRGDETINSLVDQVVSPVRFADSMIAMAGAGISVLVHVGPGDVTAGMARRTIPDATVAVVSSIEDIPTGIEAIGTMA